ncbi:venom serine protease inhibitor [Apis cerana]|uniref:Venom serine protease inhibitor n=1 Tax=Apis cerana TaxID=7461 RepID=TIL6_APICE|nr:venom serine protease inhibitor [Apis cerana]A0A2R4SV19.1 RecName: Full=Venom serine protease inhibitor; Short=AcVSPI; Short=VSPI; AltName: Full=Allergen Api m 6-like peptide; Flags: Precursor [Apis cerana]AVZ66243.1 venom serine protease inhibitor [Apis cerana]AVZ66244.1 venom serine protease inhibitor [Apis cerana]
MPRLVLVSFLFLAIFSVFIGGFAKSKCPRNEIFTRCHAACQPSCARLARKPFCIKICKPGCICTSGYLRNKNNVCVPRSRCFSGRLL